MENRDKNKIKIKSPDNCTDQVIINTLKKNC